jgi:hypothetical protein
MRETLEASPANKAIGIAKLEATGQLLTDSDLEVLRAIGELGGFSDWARFDAQHREAHDKLAKQRERRRCLQCRQSAGSAG